MTSIGIADARIQLTKLLKRVSRGERFVITKQGRPVAELIPATGLEELDVQAIIQQMEDWQDRSGPALGPDLTVRDLREEGRRF